MFGQRNSDKSLKLLKILARDKEKFIWRAAASSLIKLIRKHPKLIQEVFSCNNCKDGLNLVKKYIEDDIFTNYPKKPLIEKLGIKEGF